MANYNYEYLILDYSSKSDNYIKELATDERLSCYRVENMKFYHHSHAKNVITKFATGDIIIHLDADNLMSAEFLENVVYFMNPNIDRYIVNADNSADMFGRICISRNNFMILTGYDEHFVGWGFEDTDLVYRAKSLLGLQYIIIDEPMRPISHDNKERTKFTRFEDINSIHKIASANATIMKYNIDNKIIAPNKVWGIASVNCLNTNKIIINEN
jgi:predicted glycosyltransferase involved in capsule biosynthesis